MRPDLITVCIGMNDVTRPGPFFDRALAELDALHTRLAPSGATVVTTTFPDLAKILPIGRVLVSRVEQINGEIRTAAAQHGFRLVDLYDAPSMADPDTWSRGPGPRIDQGPHAVRRRGGRSARPSRQQPRLGA